MKFIVGTVVIIGDVITVLSAQHSWHKVMHEPGSHRTGALAVYAAILIGSVIVLGLLARHPGTAKTGTRPRYGNFTRSGR